MLEVHPKPILCVDDTEEQRYVTTKILTSAGYRVIEARTGAEALAKMSEEPLAVVLDVKLPDMSGFEVCRLIKSDPATRTTPVLQVSAAFADPEIRADGLSGGADAYVLQPFHRQELIALLRALVRSRQSEETLRFLSHASTALSASLEYAEVRERVLQMPVPRMADRCYLLTATGWDEPAESIPEYLRTPAADLLLEGNATFAGQSATPTPSRPAILVPLSTRGKRVGVLAFVLGDNSRGYLPHDMEGAVDFAGRCALALQNATLFEAQRSAQEALVRSEKLAAAGRMAASMAHEINNPLEAITNLVFLIASAPEVPDRLKKYAEDALSELASLAHLTRQTLGFYQELVKPVTFSLAESIDEVVSLYIRRLAQRQVSVERTFLTRGEMTGVKGEIRQVISNLLLNALDAMPSGGTLRFALSVEEDDLLRLDVIDSGQGVSEDLLPHIFEPFFTTKPETGTGLGLWVSDNIVRKHNGRLGVSSVPGEGTTFSVFLPLVADIRVDR